MFAIGAGGFLHELVISQAERPFLLALCGALMGLPFVLQADGKMRQQSEDRRTSDRDGEDDRWSHLP